MFGYLKPLLWCWLALHLLNAPLYAADKGAAGETPAQVMEAFKDTGSSSKGFGISDRRKAQIMFIMGVALLIFIITTVSLGVAMAVYAKPVFLPHMIFAGFSLTLAIVHSIVAIVWFFPK
jgi:hypothetical protein